MLECSTDSGNDFDSIVYRIKHKHQECTSQVNTMHKLSKLFRSLTIKGKGCYTPLPLPSDANDGKKSA